MLRPTSRSGSPRSPSAHRTRSRGRSRSARSAIRRSARRSRAPRRRRPGSSTYGSSRRSGGSARSRRSCASALRTGAGSARRERVSLEFGSANPTGPLVVVQGRTLSIGDTLARALRFAGYDVATEMAHQRRGLAARHARAFALRALSPENLGSRRFRSPTRLSGRVSDTRSPSRVRARDGDAAARAPEPDVAGVPRAVRPRRHRPRAAGDGDRPLRGDRSTAGRAEQALHATGAIAERGSNGCARSGVTYETDGACGYAPTAAGDDEARVVDALRRTADVLCAPTSPTTTSKLQRADRG